MQIPRETFKILVNDIYKINFNNIKPLHKIITSKMKTLCLIEYSTLNIGSHNYEDNLLAKAGARCNFEIKLEEKNPLVSERVSGKSNFTYS